MLEWMKSNMSVISVGLLCLLLFAALIWGTGAVIIMSVLDNDFKGNISVYAEGIYSEGNGCFIKGKIEREVGAVS